MEDLENMTRDELVEEVKKLRQGNQKQCDNTEQHNPATYFEIPVTNMKRAIQFYSQVFEIEFENMIIDNNEMALFPLYNESDGISGALAKGEIYKPSLCGTLIYLKTDNLDKTLALAIENGGTILYPKTVSEEGYAVAEFEDCEGNRIAIHQTLPA